jgi:hypothetical protein
MLFKPALLSNSMKWQSGHLAAIAADVRDFYEPLAEGKGVLAERRERRVGQDGR